MSEFKCLAIPTLLEGPESMIGTCFQFNQVACTINAPFSATPRSERHARRPSDAVAPTRRHRDSTTSRGSGGQEPPLISQPNRSSGTSLSVPHIRVCITVIDH